MYVSSEFQVNIKIDNKNYKHETRRQIIEGSFELNLLNTI